MNITNHWLQNTTHIASPNFDQRPIADDISLIVIHCISLPRGQFGHNYIDQLFCNRLNPKQNPDFKAIYQLKVSAHILIKRNGNITQYVAFNHRAWHSGVSVYKKRKNCNDFSIGIELEGTETQPYTPVQYQQLTKLVTALFVHYPHLSAQNITGHSDVAFGRKTDPGASFDWQQWLPTLDGYTL